MLAKRWTASQRRSTAMLCGLVLGLCAGAVTELLTASEQDLWFYVLMMGSAVGGLVAAAIRE